MKEVKHLKLRNTGLIFELLFKQIAADIFAGRESSRAMGIAKRFFSAGTPLHEERQLYNTLAITKADNETQANMLINETVKARLRLNEPDLINAKRSLIKEIGRNYGMDDFFAQRIDSYKVLASIYKLFEAEVNCKNGYSPNSVVQSRYAIIESICSPIKKSVIVERNDMKEVIDAYRKQDRSIQVLTYKILAEKFNEKYQSLSTGQRAMLRQYIRGISNPGALIEYIHAIVPAMMNKVKLMESQVSDGVVKIKLQELRKQMNKIPQSKVAKDEHVQAIMLGYELIKEISTVLHKGAPRSIALSKLVNSKSLTRPSRAAGK